MIGEILFSIKIKYTSVREFSGRNSDKEGIKKKEGLFSIGKKIHKEIKCNE